MPDRFGNIVGQDPAIARLRNALAGKRLPHGLLFAGPAGVGKFTTAIALASTFLGDTDDIARRVANQTHPDFHVITRQLIRHHDSAGKSKAIDLSVKVLRPELIEPANRGSIEGVGKVFIIKEADTMSTGAQNAILKTLEEPYGTTLIVLLTDQPESLLATVRSRCQTFTFRELCADEAIDVLGRLQIDEVQARRAVAVAGGSPGGAGQFLEDGIVDRAGEWFDRLDHGGELAPFLVEAAEAYAMAQLERDPLGSKDAFTRASHALYLGLAADHLRRRLAQVDEGEMEMVCEQIDAVARAERYLSANVNVSLALRQLELALR